MPTTTTYDDLLARVRALVATAEGRVPVVGISGHGGAGKSTLAHRLASDLGLGPDQVVATDAFHATTCGPDAGMWEQYDWPLLGAVVVAQRACRRPAAALRLPLVVGRERRRGPTRCRRC